MDKSWKVSRSLKSFSSKSRRSLMPPRKIRYEPFKRKILIPCKRAIKANKFVSATPSPKTCECLPAPSTPTYFKPKGRVYLELTDNTPAFDLRGNKIQAEIKSAQRYIDSGSVERMRDQVKKEYKDIVKKEKKKAEVERADLLELSLENLNPHPKAKEYFDCIKQGREEDLIVTLKEFPELTRECDSTGQSGLHWATRRRQTKIVKILLAAGVSLMKQDIVGRRCEDIARDKKIKDIFEILVMSRRNTMKTSKTLHNSEAMKGITNLMNMKIRKATIQQIRPII